MKIYQFYVLLGLSVAAMLLVACNSATGTSVSNHEPAATQDVTVVPTTAVVQAGATVSAEPTRSEATAAVEVQATTPLADRAALVAIDPSGQSLQPQLAQADIDLDDVVTLLPPDAIRAVNPEEVADIMVTAEEANQAGLDPEVRVMGVSINGQSHAYPIPFLSRREIVNAELGGRLIAATW